MEKLMIEYAALHGLKYDDYYVARGGHVVFRCFDRKQKEKWFIVESWLPFRAQPWK